MQQMFHFVFKNKKHLKNVGPIRYSEPFYIVIHQESLLPPLSHAACASMSTTTTTTRDRGDRYGPMEWAQLTVARRRIESEANNVVQVERAAFIGWTHPARGRVRACSAPRRSCAVPGPL